MALGTKRKAAQRLSVNPVSLPSGAVQEFAGSTAPEGWLMCDGAEISRTTYAALFSVIGTTYGVGDGSTTFNLPDLRGEFIRGLDNMGTAAGAKGKDSGRALGSQQSHQMPQHDHGGGEHAHMEGNDYQGFGVYGSADASSSSNRSAQGGVFSSNNKPLTSHPVDKNTGLDLVGNLIQNAGGTSNSSETRPENVAMNFIIKL